MGSRCHGLRNLLRDSDKTSPRFPLSGCGKWGGRVIWLTEILLFGAITCYCKWHPLPKFSTKNHSSLETDLEFSLLELAVLWSEAKGTAQAQTSYDH